MKFRSHALIVFLCLLLIVGWSPAQSADALKQKVDSLFIVATSGELKYRDLVGPAEDSLAALGTAGVPYLIAKLGTTDARERVGLENIFKKIGKPAVPLLNQALLATDSLQLARVGLMLNFMPDTSSVVNLLKVVKHPYYWVRYETIRVLGKIGDRRTTPTIKDALSDSNEIVRTAAAVSCGKIKDPFVIPFLMIALQDDYYGVRMSAMEALQNFGCGDKSGNYDFFNQFVDTRLGFVCFLWAIAGDDCNIDTSRLMEYFTNPDPFVRALALKAVWRREPEFVAAYLRKANMTAENIFLRQTIDEILGQ